MYTAATGRLSVPRGLFWDGTLGGASVSWTSYRHLTPGGRQSIVSQDFRALQAAYPSRSVTAFHKETSRRHANVGRGSSCSDGLSPGLPPSPRNVAVVISRQTPEGVGSLQCTDVLQDHALPSLQASEGNSFNSRRRHLRSKVSHFEVFP